MTDPVVVGRNEPCPCGSGKKYKRCHGVNSAPKLSAPKHTPPAGVDPAALENFDPQMMMQFSQALQKLPKGQVQRLQALMQKAMNGKDISSEAEEFEKTLPVDFQSMIQAMSLAVEAKNPSAALPSTQSAETTLEGPESTENEEMTEDKARALVAKAAAEGVISQEQAAELLKPKKP